MTISPTETIVLDDEAVAEIEARAAKATPGPWEVYGDSRPDIVTTAEVNSGYMGVVTSMRSACVAEMRRSLYDPSLRFSDEGIKAAITDWTNILINRLESVSIQEQEKQ